MRVNYGILELIGSIIMKLIILVSLLVPTVSFGWDNFGVPSPQTIQVYTPPTFNSPGATTTITTSAPVPQYPTHRNFDVQAPIDMTIITSPVGGD